GRVGTKAERSVRRRGCMCRGSRGRSPSNPDNAKRPGVPTGSLHLVCTGQVVSVDRTGRTAAFEAPASVDVTAVGSAASGWCLDSRERDHRLVGAGTLVRLVVDAVAAILDDGVDLPGQLLEHVLLEHGLDDLALAEDHALAVAGGDADVGVTRLAGAVHHASHDGDADWLLDVLQHLVDLVGEREEIDLDAATGRARDHGGALLAQLEALEDLVGDEH